MNTLLLRLTGPMQSWGLQSRFSVRDTGREPSKSGLLGLVCAALGIPREDEAALKALANLRMGIRVDREGKLSRDYHTALQVLKAGGGIKETEPSSRYYLADAAFLAGLEGEDLALLQQIQVALGNPVYPIFLGRKAFLPSYPVQIPDGLREGTGLEDALRNYPYLGRDPMPDRLRVVIEFPEGELMRPDQPLSFAERRFATRQVHNDFVSAPTTSKEVS